MYEDTQKKLEEVQAIMADNIEKVLVRGVKLEELNGVVEEESIQAHEFNVGAKETYIKAANQNFALRYGAPITLFTASACFMLGLVRGIPWPLLIVSFIFGAGVGVAISFGLYKAHDIFFRGKLFAESLLPNQQPQAKNPPHIVHTPSFISSKEEIAQKAMKTVVKETVNAGVSTLKNKFV